MKRTETKTRSAERTNPKVGSFLSGMSRMNRTFLISLVGLSIVMVIITVLDRVGLPLTHQEVPTIGAGILALLLIAWGLCAIRTKFRSKGPKLIYTVGMVLALAFLFMVIFLYIAQYNTYFLAQPYNTVTANGQKLVIMRAIETGISSEEAGKAAVARMDARQAAYNEAHPSLEYVEGDYAYDAYGYEYRVYPKVAGIFYNRNADSQGVIYRGAASRAKLLFESTDENTVRFYLEDEEIGDSGEVIVKVK